MGANRHRIALFALLGLGAAALIFDRALLQPSEAGAAATPRAPRADATSEPTPRGAPLPPTSVPAVAERIDALEAPEVTPDIFRADPAEWGLPQPGATSPEPQVEFRLGAIMNADASDPAAPGSCAVINSRIVRVGGSVAGFTVEQITPTSVHLRRGAETRELRLTR